VTRIAISGAGYVGLVTASCFAELGHTVNVIEIDPEKVGTLERGELPLSEPELPELWNRNKAEGRLNVTDDYAWGMNAVELAFIAVGTPSSSNGRPDLRWVRSAARSIAETAKGPVIVVMKSTVPVGTADAIRKALDSYGTNGCNIPVVSNPEFLREGAAVYDFMHPARVVIGASDQIAAEAVASLYRPLGSKIVFCDNRTAEMSKYSSNVLLATRISFINEIALLCDKYGVDIVRVAEVLGLDPRFGSGYMQAGLGWGGSCLPKDVKALISMADGVGLPSLLMRAVEKVNQEQPYVAIQKLRRLVGSLKGKMIGVLGLSFKPNSDDIREASSINILRYLNEEGSSIKAYDPVAMSSMSEVVPEVTYCEDAYEVARDSDALVLVTEWPEFKNLDMKKIAHLMNQPIFVDGRNLFEPNAMIRDGFIYVGIGRGDESNNGDNTLPLGKSTHSWGLLSGELG
jgi:UDPglucose 6-dehydrogenase